MYQVEVIKNVPVIVGNDEPTFATAGKWVTVEDGEETVLESCFFLSGDVQDVYDFSYWNDFSEDCIYSKFEWAEDGPVLQEVWLFKSDGTKEQINDR